MIIEYELTDYENDQLREMAVTSPWSLAEIRYTYIRIGKPNFKSLLSLISTCAECGYGLERLRGVL